MTDLNPKPRASSGTDTTPGAAGQAGSGGNHSALKTPSIHADPTIGPAHTDDEVVRFIELMFFAYRAFIHEPDAILEEIGYGRAHHRVLHFVQRHPGIRISRLLVILGITKQSLAPVLKQLIADGFVAQVPGDEDKRERHLELTSRGATLFARLVQPQRERVRAALDAAGEAGAQDAVRRFLWQIVPADAREDLAEALTDLGVALTDGEQAGTGDDREAA
ncbi:MAG: MarR family transcriptional regulator [Pseudomonadota bacterium]